MTPMEHYNLSASLFDELKETSNDPILDLNNGPLYIFDNHPKEVDPSVFIDGCITFALPNGILRVKTMLHDGCVGLSWIKIDFSRPDYPISAQASVLFYQGETKLLRSFAISPEMYYPTHEMDHRAGEDMTYFVREPNLSNVDGADNLANDLGLIMKCYFLIQSPLHYVVSESPRSIPNSPKKARRFHQRERFIILNFDQLKFKYAQRVNMGGTHSSPAPHLRRGHTMHLLSPRYVNKQGQIIIRRPTYVGDREWTGEYNLKYKVISRPGATENQA